MTCSESTGHGAPYVGGGLCISTRLTLLLSLPSWLMGEAVLGSLEEATGDNGGNPLNFCLFLALSAALVSWGLQTRKTLAGQRQAAEGVAREDLHLTSGASNA